MESPVSVGFVDVPHRSSARNATAMTSKHQQVDAIKVGPQHIIVVNCEEGRGEQARAGTGNFDLALQGRVAEHQAKTAQALRVATHARQSNPGVQQSAPRRIVVFGVSIRDASALLPLELGAHCEQECLSVCGLELAGSQIRGKLQACCTERSLGNVSAQASCESSPRRGRRVPDSSNKGHHVPSDELFHGCCV